ncbi:hypothetical protein L6172_04945 [Thalassospiraceae bacterium SW-3-3]|nr:hypothetical protein L6172_04945 [Thalassospiraceae bacterium SW-3-3]
MQFKKVSASKADYDKNIVVRFFDADGASLAELRTPIDSDWGPADQAEKVLGLAIERSTEAGFRDYGIQIIDDDDLWEERFGELVDDPGCLVKLQSQPLV